MIEHPYYELAELDRDAHEAAKTRALYYGAAGFVDPRTYTVDVYTIRRVYKQPWLGTLRLSLQAAGYGAAYGATMGYLGFDLLNVTPGYGFSPEGESMTVDGVPVNVRDQLFDMRQFYM